MLKTEKVNDYKIEPKVKSKIDKRPYSYSNVFNHPFPNIYLCAKKNSGKSVLISNLIDILADKKNTEVIIFSSTIKNDQLFIEYVKKRNKDGYNIKVSKNPDDLHTHTDLVEKFLDDPKRSKVYYDYPRQFPLAIYIMDDFRISLREDKYLNDIASRNRHYKSVIIYSSQRYRDVSTIVRINLNVLVLFAGMNEVNIKTCYEECINDMKLSYEDFKLLYDDATREKYGFLYIDVDLQEFRKNLSNKYVL